MITKILFFISLFSILHVAAFSQAEIKKIQLEDAVVSRKFTPESIPGIRSMKDGEHYTTLQKGTWVVRYRYSDGLPVDTLFSLKWFSEKQIPYISEYELSGDESKMLITTYEKPIYRHSFTADYYVFDVPKRTLEPLSAIGLQQLATFSPTSDQVAFVRENNLFVVDLATHKETQVTSDGKHNEIINGAPDWVYEEEFSFNNAFEWSPDGRKLAFMRFDERQVKMYTIPIYDSLYPTLYTYKYPKADEKIRSSAFRFTIWQQVLQSRWMWDRKPTNTYPASNGQQMPTSWELSV
jgi:dipeptidyl-peptidase-4